MIFGGRRDRDGMNEMTDKVGTTRRVAIIEDDPNLLDHFIGIVTNVASLDLAGVASSFADGRKLIALKPDLFLVDIGLPDGSGLDLVPEIKQASDARVLIVTSFGDRQTVVDADVSFGDHVLTHAAALGLRRRFTEWACAPRARSLPLGYHVRKSRAE
jgi:ActR/RegA family two-component response regulator